MLKDITKLSKDELISLEPKQVARRLLRPEEIWHIVNTFNVCWRYDYEKAKIGRVGYHAELSGGDHSDVFFNFPLLFNHKNLLIIMAEQLVLRHKKQADAEKPDWVAGIPNGAKVFGGEVSHFLNTRSADLRKDENRMILKSRICPIESVLLVEDVCTKGTAFKKAILAIRHKQPRAMILDYVLVFMRRGIPTIKIDDCEYKIVSLINIENKDQDNRWAPALCPLCKMGSQPIKPKNPPASWILLTSSQA